MNLIEQMMQESRNLNQKSSKKKVNEEISGKTIETTEDLCNLIGCEYSNSWGSGLLYVDSPDEAIRELKSAGLTDNDYYVADANDIDHGLGNPSASVQVIHDNEDYDYFTVDLLFPLALTESKKTSLSESDYSNGEHIIVRAESESLMNKLKKVLSHIPMPIPQISNDDNDSVIIEYPSVEDYKNKIKSNKTLKSYFDSGKLKFD